MTTATTATAQPETRGIGTGAAPRRSQRALLRRRGPDGRHRPDHRSRRGGARLALQRLRQQGRAGGGLPRLAARRHDPPAHGGGRPVRRSASEDPGRLRRPGRSCSSSPTSTGAPSSPRPPRLARVASSNTPLTNSGHGSGPCSPVWPRRPAPRDPVGLGRQLHLLYDGAGLAARMDHCDPGIAQPTREAAEALLDAALGGRARSTGRAKRAREAIDV